MFDDVFPIDQRVKSLLLMAKSRYLLGYAPTMATLIIKYGTPPKPTFFTFVLVFTVFYVDY